MTCSSAEPPSARAAWEREYAELRAYTTSYRDDLDRGVQFLQGYLAGAGMALAGPVLECACGRGRNAIPLARAGHVVLGLDHATTALKQFRSRAAGEGVRCRALAARHDLREPLPLRDAAVGTVLDITAVDNLVDPGQARAYGRELARVLRPGGLAVVVTFDRDDGYYGPFRANEDAAGSVVRDPNTSIRNRLFRAASLDALFVPGLERIGGNRFDFIDAAARTSWTRRFHLRLYRKPTG